MTDGNAGWNGMHGWMCMDGYTQQGEHRHGRENTSHENHTASDRKTTVSHRSHRLTESSARFTKGKLSSTEPSNRATAKYKATGVGRRQQGRNGVQMGQEGGGRQTKTTESRTDGKTGKRKMPISFLTVSYSSTVVASMIRVIVSRRDSARGTCSWTVCSSYTRSSWP